MARLTLGQKADRVLKLLLGLRNPRIAQALSMYGFSQTDLDEGWRLLRALSNTRLSTPLTGPVDPEALKSLDAWENRWFPITGATLKRHFPDVHDYIFRNLSQTEGPEVVVSVSTFLRRIADLTRSTSGLGDKGKKAKTLLEQRGLKSSVIRSAQDLLERVGTIEPEETSPSPEALEVEIQKAEQALWTWYLEWAQIARVGITRRSLLRQLGFLTDRGARTASVDEIDEIDAIGDDIALADGDENEADELSEAGARDTVVGAVPVAASPSAPA